jgi:hypothetical protein
MFIPFSAGIVKRIKIDPIKSPFIGKKVFNKINKFPKSINPNKG